MLSTRLGSAMQGWLDAKKTDGRPTGKSTISNAVPDAVVGCRLWLQMLGSDVDMRLLTGRSVLKPATRAGPACHQSVEPSSGGHKASLPFLFVSLPLPARKQKHGGVANSP
ncbi:hypothetical protein V8C42DRAFT_314382 [Trichoderma barbatum]